MKIRTQLVVAFLLLAVLPLTGIVLYSYVSSLRAVRRETESQAGMLAGEIKGRMASIKNELGRGVERMGDLPAQDILAAAQSTRRGRTDPIFDQMVAGFGDAATYVRSLEFVPLAPVVKLGAEVGAPGAPPVPPTAPVPPAPPDEHVIHRVVIDVPQILREARKEAKAAVANDPVALEAIDQALEALADDEDEKAEAAAAAAEDVAEAAADAAEAAAEDTAELTAPVPPVPPAPPEARARIGIPKEAMERIKEQIQEQAEARKKVQEDMRVAERERRRVAREQALEKLVLGRSLEVPVWERGKVVGKVMARISGDDLLRRVLTRTRNTGEIPFAIDAEGELHTETDDDRRTLSGLHASFTKHVRAGSGPWAFGYWAVATSGDPESGLVFGIARPMPLQDVRRTAARNFGYGLGMIGLALFGILPLSTRMTRNVKLVTEGADRIAKGDLNARVPVRSRNEFGKLALAFNQMAEDLKGHQDRLLEEERLRKEREIEQALLQTEYERKTHELEEARRFQLSLLPKALPEHPGFEIAVSMRTATEVGGDYYDFYLADDGALTVAVGDATGHGATAGTMVTVVKSLFSADAGASRPRQFLAEAARAVKRMELGRMAMGLCLARLEGRSLTLSSAGMPPVFVCHQATGRADEIALPGMPLGGLASEYQEEAFQVDPGDTILLMTDGLPELTNADGDPLGYPRVRSLFESLSGKPPAEVIAGLTAAAESWTAGLAPKDDMTLVVVRMRG